MNEQHPESPELGHEVDKKQPAEVAKETQEVDSKSVEVEQAKQLESARDIVETQTAETDKVLNKLEAETTTPEDAYRPPVNKELKNINLKKEIKTIRRQLNKPDQLVSKIIHQPAVRIISEVSSKTISRPSGLLGGGITAFLGSGLYYYFTKHIGLKYNYLIFVMLFVVGFGFGLCIELLVWSLHSRKKMAR